MEVTAWVSSFKVISCSTVTYGGDDTLAGYSASWEVVL